jgi:hypothetical protein
MARKIWGQVFIFDKNGLKIQIQKHSLSIQTSCLMVLKAFASSTIEAFI